MIPLFVLVGCNLSYIVDLYLIIFVLTETSGNKIGLRWLVTVSSTFQDLEFDGSL